MQTLPPKKNKNKRGGEGGVQTLPNQKIRIRSLNFGTTSVVLAGFRFGGMQAIAELFPIRGLLLARVQGGSVKPQWFLLLGWFLFWARSIFGGGGGVLAGVAPHVHFLPICRLP